MTKNYPIKNGKVAILLHEGILGPSGKTGLAFLRYSEAQIVDCSSNRPPMCRKIFV